MPPPPLSVAAAGTLPPFRSPPLVDLLLQPVLCILINLLLQLAVFTARYHHNYNNYIYDCMIALNNIFFSKYGGRYAMPYSKIA